MRAFRSGLIQREKVVQLATPIIMSLMAFHSRSRRGEKSAWRERFGYRIQPGTVLHRRYGHYDGWYVHGCPPTYTMCYCYEFL